MGLRVGVVVGLGIALGAGAARAEVLIIDVTQQDPSHRKKQRAAGPAQPDLHLLMNSGETTRNLSGGVQEHLRSLGYQLTPEIDWDNLSPPPPPETPGHPVPAKTLLRFDVMRAGGGCFITAKAAELTTPETFFWRWETKDDSKSCTAQLREVVEGFFAVRAPLHAKPAGPDAGVAAADAGTPVADADAGPPAAGAKPRFVLAPTTLGTGEQEPAAATPPEPAAAADPDEEGEPAPKPVKKGCGCGTAGGPTALAGLLGLVTLSRRRPRRAAR